MIYQLEIDNFSVLLTCIQMHLSVNLWNSVNSPSSLLFQVFFFGWLLKLNMDATMLHPFIFTHFSKGSFLPIAFQCIPFSVNVALLSFPVTKLQHATWNGHAVSHCNIKEPRCTGESNDFRKSNVIGIGILHYHVSSKFGWCFASEMSMSWVFASYENWGHGLEKPKCLQKAQLFLHCNVARHFIVSISTHDLWQIIPSFNFSANVFLLLIY